MVLFIEIRKLLVVWGKEVGICLIIFVELCLKFSESWF